MSQLLDQLGFVSVDEIQNVFSFELSKIDNELSRDGMPLDYKIVVEWIDSIRLTLMQRARTNVEDYLRKNPAIRKEKREVKAQEMAEGKSSHDSWQDKVKANREEAIREAYK